MLRSAASGRKDDLRKDDLRSISGAGRGRGSKIRLRALRHGWDLPMPIGSTRRHRRMMFNCVRVFLGVHLLFIADLASKIDSRAFRSHYAHQLEELSRSDMGLILEHFSKHLRRMFDSTKKAFRTNIFFSEPAGLRLHLTRRQLQLTL